MTSATPIDNNPANPTHATGPRTAEGKAKSSQNSRKHGLCSDQLVIREDQREAYNTLHDSLYEELEPANRMESIFVDQMIVSDWNMARIREMEVQYHQNNPEARSDISSHKELILLRRYYVTAERGFFRALRELRLIQSTRIARHDTHQPGPILVKALPPSHRSLLNRLDAIVNAPPPSDNPVRNEPQAPAPKPPASAKTPRNATCPCGSHIKYKRCCGRNTNTPA